MCSYSEETNAACSSLAFVTPALQMAHAMSHALAQRPCMHAGPIPVRGWIMLHKHTQGLRAASPLGEPGSSRCRDVTGPLAPAPWRPASLDTLQPPCSPSPSKAASHRHVTHKREPKAARGTLHLAGPVPMLPHILKHPRTQRHGRLQACAPVGAAPPVRVPPPAPAPGYLHIRLEGHARQQRGRAAVHLQAQDECAQAPRVPRWGSLPAWNAWPFLLASLT